MLADEDYTIEKNPVRIPAEDYDLLRSTGLDHIQSLSSNVWTDYNIHDPGVTILELLCYALTDLGYRTSFDIQDILTPAGRKGPEMDNAFYSANTILTSHPITINDYRKLIIEKVPGVRNAWFEIEDNEVYIPAIGFDEKNNTNIFVDPASPGALQLKGLYKVKIELEDFEIIKEVHKDIFEILIYYQKDKSRPVTAGNYKECYTNYIKSILMSHRNICEDFNEVTILKKIPVGICADIELKPEANDESVLLEIYKKLYEYVNPSIKLYTFQQLLDKGRTIEQIFQGSAVNRGFIDYDELNAFDRKKVLYTSDLINIIMDIDGVLNIRSIKFNIKNSIGNVNTDKYCLHLDDEINSSFRFSFDLNAKPDKRLNKIIFRKGHICFYASPTKEWKRTEVIDYPKDPDGFEIDLPLPVGNNRQLDKYISIQDEFPKTYMVGREGISNSASDLRKAQCIQLKSYLLFFDQLLADYLAQLNSVKNLLSWRDPEAEPTYHFKQLTDAEILDFIKLLPDYGKYQLTLEPEKLEKNRRNRLLDHLLARFNEKFTDYTIFKFLQDSEGSTYAKFGNNEIIHNKKDYLKNYPVISGSRSHALDYSQPASKNNFNVLEFRISKALGIDANKVERIFAPEVIDNNPSKMIFKDNSNGPFDETFGLHIYEHILFRPLYDDTIKPEQEFIKLYYGEELLGISSDSIVKDPYSMKATIAVPGWLTFSGRMEFRRFIEQKIRMEMPAHVALKICWINPRQMFEIENNYNTLLLKLHNLIKPGNNKIPKEIKAYKKALNQMVISLSSLNNMYPPSVLDEPFDFITANSKQTPVILDNTALAGGDDQNWAFEDTAKVEKTLSKKTSKTKPTKKRIIKNKKRKSSK